MIHLLEIWKIERFRAALRAECVTSFTKQLDRVRCGEQRMYEADSHER